MLLVLPAPLVSLDRWDPGYHLLIGNEEGGERPWEGEIAYVAVYGRSLEAEHASESFARPPGTEESTTSRQPMGLLAAYDFTTEPRLVVEPEGTLRTIALRVELGAESVSLSQPAVRLLDRRQWDAAGGACRSPAGVAHVRPA
jgi:hypothetical protein